jgi:hypothetical protein
MYLKDKMEQAGRAHQKNKSRKVWPPIRGQEKLINTNASQAKINDEKDITI